MSIQLPSLRSALAVAALAPLASSQVFETDVWVANDLASLDWFGRSIAIEGDLAAIGAPRDDDNGIDSGSVYLYQLSTGLQVGKLTPSDGAAGDRFGTELATFGDYLAVSAPLDSDFGNESGSVTVFRLSTQQQVVKLLAADGAAGDRFGWSVAVHGDQAFVGAPDHDTPAGIGAGAVYVFDLPSGVQTNELATNDAAQADALGRSVACDGVHVLVGSDAGGAGFFRGAAYLFDLATGTQLDKWVPADSAAQDRFGYALVLDGDRAVLGAHGNTGGLPKSLYVYDVPTGLEVGRLAPADVLPGDRFGEKLALSGDYLLASFLGFGGSGPVDGSARLFHLPSATQVVLAGEGGPAPGGDGFDSFSSALALSGDRALIGAFLSDLVASDAGAVYVYDLAADAGSAYCFGDGAGAACPCGANGAADAGCANTFGVGASLTATGGAFASQDTFQLAVSGAPPDKVGLLLRGKNPVAGGAGLPAGDGLLCVTGQTARSQVQMTSAAGETSFTDWNGQPIGAASYGAGVRANYQFWYRDPAATCSGQGFNFSSAWSVVWLP